MDDDVLRVLHVVSAQRWQAEDSALPAFLRALQGQPGIHNEILVTGSQEDAAAGRQVFASAVRAATPRRTRPHIVHLHGGDAAPLGAGIALRTRSALLLGIEEERDLSSGWRGGLMRGITALCIRKPTGVVCTSPSLAERTSAHTRAGISVIEPSIDLAALDAQRASVPAPMDGAFHVALIGPFTEARRLDMALAAAYLLARDQPGRFHFHVIGEGESLARCTAFVQRHGLANAVHFHGHQAPLAPWLARMHALLWCPDRDCAATRVLEAMALGVPVVAHAVGGLPHLLGGGTCGTLVTEHAPYAYACAIAALAADPATRVRRAEAAARRVRSHHEVAGVVKRYAALYRSLDAVRQKTLDVCYL
ncbi:MAG: glycosyltransferase [Gammaproteobacteria bacterium]|nr:glycosyltransferase [Gammaproteobacteria bacterium]